MKKIIFILIIITAFPALSKAQVPVWTELGTGANALNANDVIQSICTDSSGNVYAAGDFTNSSGYYYVAKWNGSNWEEVKSNTSSLNANGQIRKIIVDNNGNLYAAGNFTNASVYQYVAKWDGNVWTELGGTSGPLNANATICDLSIDANGNMYAAGWFTNANSKFYVAKWNGLAWSELGNLDALNTQAPFYSEGINALCNDNNGNIYAGGTFVDSSGLYIVKWNGG